MAKSKIVVMGSLNVDMITRTPRLPGPGETLIASSFVETCGGKGANQATACSRASGPRPESSNTQATLLIEVAMIGAVGSNPSGTNLRDVLARNGVNVQNVGLRKGNSGIAVIIVDEATGENRIMYTPGANRLVTPDMYRFIAPPLPDLVILQFEIPVETVLAVMEEARKQGTQVLLNPSPPMHIPMESYKGLAHLVMNQTEAITLGGETAGEGASALLFVNLFERFDSLGVQNTIVTLGADGVYYSTGRGKYEHVEGVKVKDVVDTTGAGDTFVGFYAVEVVQGQREKVPDNVIVPNAVRRANRAAALAVQKAGAMESIPWMNDLKEEEREVVE